MISFENVSLHFGDRKLFDELSFMINPKDRIGLVGKNGAGKSTLMKAIVKQANIDKGQIVLPSDITVGYLPQHIQCVDSRSVMDEALTAFSELHHIENEIEHLTQQLTDRTDYETNSYMELVEMVSEKSERLHMLNAGSAEANAEKTLIGLGFESNDLSRPTGEFSGGWRMRIELAKILLKAPDVFLLDEPTNHLDIESIQWLENFLIQYHGAVILISHDRTFLDNITTRTLEISLGKIHDYKANYSRYLELRGERRELLLAAFRNQQKQIEDTQEFIDRFRYKASKSVQVQSRIKQLDKINVIELDVEDQSAIHIRFPSAPRAGSIVYEAKDLTKRYGNHIVLENLNIIVERGEKIAFVGRNGEGKSTLSKIITEGLEYEGISKIGHNVHIGYFAQNQEELINPEKTVLQILDDVAVGDVRTKIRDILGAFLFSGDDVDKKVKILSGGERSRLAMAKLLLEPYNLLVLDEPTNHLDMRSKDILKQALKNYDGTLILVSHDREFLSGLSDKIYEFKSRKIREHRCDIFEFLKKKKLETLGDLNRKVVATSSAETIVKVRSDVDQKQVYQERKEIDKEIRKLANRVEFLEKEIENSDAKIITMDLNLNNGNPQDTAKFYQEYNLIKKHNADCMAEWEKLQIDMEELQKKRKAVN